MGFFKPSPDLFKKLPKIAGITGLIGGGVAALPIAAMSLRNSRARESEALPSSLVAPIPQVLEYTPPAEATTLMGQERVEGEFAKRYKNQQKGLSAGPDTSAPNLMRPDGRNAITGSSAPVEDLNAPATFSR